MRKRSLFCRPVSLCPFDTLVNGIHTAEDFVKLFVWSLVFFDPNTDTQFQGGGAKYTGWEIFCDFRLKSPFMSERVRDRPLVTTRNVNRKSWAADGSVSIPMTLSDPNRVSRSSQISLRDKSNMS